MCRQPATYRAAFTVLFVVPILRNDEIRLPRHDPVMPGRHQSGGEHRVEILGLVLAALTMRAVRAMDLVAE